MKARMRHFLLGLSGTALLAGGAWAQDDFDAQAAATARVETGLNLARRQIAASDLTGALGALERLLFAYPEAVPARLLYAALLCRLDDRRGADLELGLLAGKPIADGDWSQVVAACGTVQRPAPPKRKSK